MKTASLSIAMAVLSLSCLAAPPQKGSKPGKSKYVVAPSENTLVTVASQSDCPLRIENAQLLLNVETSWAFRFSYQLRNGGDKPIRSFTLYFWTSEGSGGTLVSDPLKAGILAPGERVASYPQSDEGIVLPLTEELRQQLRIGRPMKMVIVLMVESVTFADGSMFSDETTLQALKEYFDDRCP